MLIVRLGRRQGQRRLQTFHTPRTGELYDLYDVFPLDDLDLSGQIDRSLIAMF